MQSAVVEDAMVVSVCCGVLSPTENKQLTRRQFIGIVFVVELDRS